MPRQQRGERRVAALLHAAADVIAESGYEAATMTEIADRAGACIGSLYQFFPSKQSLTQTLRAKYGNEFQKLWAPLEDSAASLSIEQLVGRLIDETVQFIETHPAILSLLDAPCSTRNPPIRKLLRQHLARALKAKEPRLPEAAAMRCAIVILQTVKGLNELYSEFDERDRKALIAEFKFVLIYYVTSRLKSLAAEGVFKT